MATNRNRIKRVVIVYKNNSNQPGQPGITQNKMKKAYEVIDDNYATPKWLYDQLNAEFNFDFDPCPYNEKQITPETDGLLKDWGSSNYINPPYSRGIKDEFVKKALHESKKGKLCVLLIPASTGSKLFHEVIKPNAIEIRFLQGRIKFDKKCTISGEFKPSKDSARFDSMIVVFDGRN